MGPKYSKGVRNTPLKLDHLKSMTILEVRSKAIMMSKLYGKKNLYFFENRELEEVMELSGEEVYLCNNLFAKNAGMTRISSLDFWCGLALAASGANDDKLTFCAKIIDTNGDDLLSYHEVLVLFLCATRGIACLKGLEFIPEETLDKVVMDAFASNQKTLKENGEIPIHTLVSFLLSQELCRSYLVALGAKIPPIDTAALVTKRVYYLKELTSLQCDIEETMIFMQEEDERRQFEHERGGDIDYIRSIVDTPRKSAHEIQVRRHSSIKPLATILGKDHAIDEEHLDRDKLPPSHPANTLYKTDESWRYELYNPKPGAPLVYQPKPVSPLHIQPNANFNDPNSSAVNFTPSFTSHKFGNNSVSPFAILEAFVQSNTSNQHNNTSSSRFSLLKHRSGSFSSSAGPAQTKVSIFSKAFEDRFRKEWKKLPNDEMLVASTLDPLVLMAMLEQVDIIIPLSTSRRIIDSAKRSQLGCYEFKDILYCLRCHYNTQTPDSQTLAPDARLIYHWTTQIKRYCLDMYQSCKSLFETMAWQRRVLQGVDRAGFSTNLAKKLAEFRNMAFKRPFSIDAGFYINEDMIQKKPNAAEDRLQGIDVYDFPLKLQLMLNTVPFTNLSTKRPRECARLKLVNDYTRDIYMVEGFSEMQANDLLDFFNLKFEETFAERQEEKIRQAAEAAAAKKLAEGNTGTLEEIQSQSIAAKLAKEREEQAKASRRASLGGTGKSLANNNAIGSSGNAKEDAEQKKRRKNGEDEPREYEMVTWFCVDLLPGLEEAHAIVVREALRNFFSSIPYGSRKELYHDVICEIVTPIVEMNGSAKSYSEGSANANPLSPAGKDVSSTSNNASPGKTTSKANFFSMLNKAKRFSSAAAMNASYNLNPDSGSGSPTSGGVGGLATRKVVLVALCHEQDGFGKLEQTLLETDLYVSRSIQSFKFEFYLAQTMETLFARSLDYHHFHEKLFGPIEDELGEHGSNPLKFAKDLRVRKKQINELLARLNDMPREECMTRLREDGWNDRGTPPELRERVKRMLTEKTERMGHGELSAFGKRNIEVMFYRMKNQLPPSPCSSPVPSRPTTATSTMSKKDNMHMEEGLSLWEMNELLEKSDTKTFYSKREYLTFMLEEELLMDRDQQLTLRGLQRYYEKHGRLAEDILRWGTGGLDALLAGYVHVSLDFDPEGLYSLFNLMEARPMIVPHALKVLGDMCSWKEVKIDGRLERFSEVFDFLPFDRLGLPGLKDRLNQILRQPGGLIEILEFLFSRIFQSEAGIIPVMRRYLSSSGFEYTTFHDAFTDVTYVDSLNQEISEKLHVLVEEETQRVNELNADAKRLAEEEDNRWITEKMTQLKSKYYAQGNILITEEMMRTEATTALEEEKQKKQAMVDALMVEQLSDINGKANKSGKKPNQTLKQQQEEDHEMLFLRRQSAIREDIMVQKARAILPAILLPDSTIDLSQIRQQIIDDLIFLHRVRTVEGMSFTLEESVAIDERRTFLENKLESIEVQLQEEEKSLMTHSIALYDILRHFATGISSFGCGTKDICLRGFTEGVPFIPVFCMPGCGELSFMHERAKTKRERFEQRKQLALAAIERERLRRTMTAEDHSRIKRLKERKIKARFAKDEKRNFLECHKAFRNLCIENRIHKRKIPMIDWANIIKRYEQLMKVQDEKYPQALPAQIMKNNIALLYYEVYGLEHPLSEPAQYLLQEAAERMLTLEEDQEDIEDEQQEEREREKAAEHAKDPNHALDQQLLTASQSINNNMDGSAAYNSTINSGHLSGVDAAMERKKRKQVRLIIKIIVILQYFQMLTEVDNLVALKQASALKYAIYEAYHELQPAYQLLLSQYCPISKGGIFWSEVDLTEDPLELLFPTDNGHEIHISCTDMLHLKDPQSVVSKQSKTGHQPQQSPVQQAYLLSSLFITLSSPSFANSMDENILFFNSSNTASLTTSSLEVGNSTVSGTINPLSKTGTTINTPLFCGSKAHDTFHMVDEYQHQLLDFIRQVEQQDIQQQQNRLSPSKRQTKNHKLRANALSSSIISNAVLQRETPQVRFYWQDIPVYAMKNFHLSPWLHSILQEVQHLIDAESSRMTSLQQGDDDLSSLGSLSKSMKENGSDWDSDEERNEEDDMSGVTSNSSGRRRKTSKRSSKLSSKSSKSYISENMSMRREKRQKFEAQKKLDALKRQEVARQRNFLYRLIQTDQISDIFARKAGHVQESSSPHWGGSVKPQKTKDAKEETVDELAQQFESLAMLRASSKDSFDVGSNRQLSAPTGSGDDNLSSSRTHDSFNGLPHSLSLSLSSAVLPTSPHHLSRMNTHQTVETNNNANTYRSSLPSQRTLRFADDEEQQQESARATTDNNSRNDMNNTHNEALPIATAISVVNMFRSNL